MASEPALARVDLPPARTLSAAALYATLQQAVMTLAPSFDVTRRMQVEASAYALARGVQTLATSLPAGSAAVLEKTVRHAYKVTDQEIAALLQGGLSEDEVLDLVLCTAMGAGRARLEAGLRALGKEVR